MATTTLSLYKLLQPSTVARLILVGKALLVLSIIGLGVFGVQRIASAAFMVKAQSLSMENWPSIVETEAAKPKTSHKIAGRDFTDAVKRNLFGPISVAPVAAASQGAKPVSTVPLDLVGTYITGDSKPYAIIEDRAKKSQEIFLVGDSIFDAAKLSAIFNDRVEIERNGKQEILTIDLAPRSNVDYKDGVAQIGSDEYFVEEAEVDKAINNLPLLLTQARAVPYFKDGQAVGLRLFAIRSGSLFEKIGLKNGDILRAINGNSLGDLSQAIKLFERLKTERSLSLSLERERQEREFKYQVR